MQVLSILRFDHLTNDCNVSIFTQEKVVSEKKAVCLFVVCLFVCLVGWLDGWLVGWLFGCLVVWLFVVSAYLPICLSVGLPVRVHLFSPDRP